MANEQVKQVSQNNRSGTGGTVNTDVQVERVQQVVGQLVQRVQAGERETPADG